MFETISEKFLGVFAKLRNVFKFSKENIDDIVKNIAEILAAADTAQEVNDAICTKIQTKFAGYELRGGVTADQLVMKIVYEEIVAMLSSEPVKYKSGFNRLMLVGLQGNGKTLSAAKIAWLLREEFYPKNSDAYGKIALVPMDFQRPAAIEQLRIYATQAAVDFVEPPHNCRDSLEMAHYANHYLRDKMYRFAIFDTAGRLHSDALSIKEVAEIQSIIQPNITMFVIDAMTGKSALETAKQFSKNMTIDRLFVTKTDTEAKAGCILSAKYITDCAIAYAGNGERVTDITLFDAQRVTEMMLGMGDIKSLVEKISKNLSEEEAKMLQDKAAAGQFTLDDFAQQLQQMQHLGGIGNLMKMIPGMSAMANKIPMSQVNDMFKSQMVIISSMTKKERKNYKIIDGSRRKRIAYGAGRSINDVNILLKQYEQAREMMKNAAQTANRGGGMMSMLKNIWPK